jgi:4-hydroxysphinganine ceramide fatty acyl 2-hydroxylase
MNTKPRPRMYDNPLMELLSQSGPKMMITIHLMLIFTQIYYGLNIIHFNDSGVFLCFVFLSGTITWSLAEYLLHRKLFHLKGSSDIMKAFHYTLHGYHHKNPTDANRLFMPPVPALLFLSVFFGLFYLLIGKFVWFFLPGFELGYLIYSFIHYSIHTRKAPKFLEPLWHHHILHHYKAPEKAYGVSSRFWDRVFRTLPE